MSSMNAFGSPLNVGVGPVQDLRGGDALVLLGREAAGEDGLGDQGQRDAQVEGRGDGPLARPLLAGGVEDQVDHRLAGLGVVEAEDVAGDLDQVAVERALVPAGEDVVHGVGRPCRAASFMQVVGLADELHVAVFDAVVDHLDVVARPLGPDPVAAGGAVGDLGGDRLEDRLDVRPGSGLPPGMIDGPLSAPSSPPETPVPTNSSPFALRAWVRRVVSG